MRTEEYRELASQLRKPADITRLAKERGLERELLLIIYTHRVVRDATKRYYRVKNKADRLIAMWKSGTTLVQISRNEDFPPILMSLLLLRQMGYPRKEFWDYVREPEKIKNARLAKEIFDVARDDIIYSLEGMEVQAERGRRGEAWLANWLDRYCIKYRTENQLKAEFKKTPDFLLDEPMVIDGEEICWFESKANFGDRVEINRNMKKQLVPYTEMFGKGIVVYWFGFVDDYRCDVEGVRIVDAEFFKRAAPAKNEAAGADS